jgi:hypothetical protein
MIEVLKQVVMTLDFLLYGDNPDYDEACKTLEVGKHAIAELESQEPVGRFAKFTDGVWRPVTDYSAGVPLYTHPQQRTWVGLTKQQRNDIEDICEMIIGEPAFNAIEAQLKENNT